MSRTLILILALALTTLVGVGFPASAVIGTTNIGANDNNLLPTGLTITVNATGDGSALDPNSSCDVDAGTSGDQCTLRSAIQHANAVAGADTIDFQYPVDSAQL